MELIQQQSVTIICRHCEAAVQQASVRKKLAELGLTPKEDVRILLEFFKLKNFFLVLVIL